MEVTTTGQLSPSMSPIYTENGQPLNGKNNQIIVTSATHLVPDSGFQMTNGTILEMTNETFGQLTGGLLPVSENGSQSPTSQIVNGQLPPKSLGQPSQSNRSNAMSAAKSKGGKSPTCKVCGDESSGFHYGVDSCEGCKGFFRRCITQGMTHKCSNEEKCEITPFTRNSCQYCRLKKCFAVGMSREASRLGRRPKRLKDSSGEPKQPSVNLPIAPYPSPAELYKLRMAELQRLLQQNGTFKSELMQAFLAAAQVSFREHQRHGNDNQKTKTGSTESGYSSMSPSNSSKSHSPVSDGGAPRFNNNQNQNIDTKDLVNEDLPDNFRIAQETNLLPTDNRPNVDQFSIQQIKTEPDFDNVKSPTSPVSSAGGASPLIMPDNMMLMGGFSPDSLTPEMMKMMMSPEAINAFMDNGNMNNVPSEYSEPDPNANVIDIERIMEEVRQVPTENRHKLMCQVSTQVAEAHALTCHCTYESVSAAQERHEQQMMSVLSDMSKLSLSPKTLWDMFVQNMLPEITQVVKFCKKLPGFGEIGQEDQIILIKQGSFETLACRMCLMVDTERNEMFTPDLKLKCSRSMIKGTLMGQFLEELFVVAESFNPLALKESEIGLFTAVLLMCPDRPGLGKQEEVQKLNGLFTQTLYMAIKQNYEDYDNKFARLIGMIPLFRSINKKHSMSLNNLKMHNPEMMQELPPLHKEVYDLSD